jgi:hypothetical protein
MEAFFVTVLHDIYNGTSFSTMSKPTYLPYVGIEGIEDVYLIPINAYMFNIWRIFLSLLVNGRG